MISWWLHSSCQVTTCALQCISSIWVMQICINWKGRCIGVHEHALSALKRWLLALMQLTCTAVHWGCIVVAMFYSDASQKNMGDVVPASHYSVVTVTSMHLFHATMQTPWCIACSTALQCKPSDGMQCISHFNAHIECNPHSPMHNALNRIQYTMMMHSKLGCTQMQTEWWNPT